MSAPALRVDRLSKAYRIARAVNVSSYRTLREDMADSLARLFRRRSAEESTSTIWALREASFEVGQGEVVGIIGRNGAGKSTLLKVISRIVEPTSGRAEVFGRVGTLLEIGTGFHPELTGRENVFLSGAVLGMRRAEIASKLPDIFAFAGVEEFAETPVKRYSSGMFMRLAFAVAAHLEPEILIVDEVLAVGDAAFQKKSLGKMQDVSRSGRTVLFVSHNMAAIQQLCTRVIVLEAGAVVFDGSVEAGVQRYLEQTRTESAEALEHRPDRRGSGRLRFTRVELLDAGGQTISTALSGSDLRVRLHYAGEVEKPRAAVNVAFNVRSPQGYLLTNLNSVDTGRAELPLHRTGYFECRWPRLGLRSGTYECALFCSIDGEIADWLQNAFLLEVEDGDFYGTGKLASRDQGDLLIDCDWSAGTP